MGLVSFIPNVFNYGTKAVNYSIKGIQASPYIIFGKGAEEFVEGAKGVSKAAGESWITAFWRAVKTGGKAVKTDGNIFKQSLAELRSLPAVVKKSVNYNAARSIVKAGGKNAGPIAKVWAGISGGTKGFFKGLGKKMPLIGNLMLVAFELPNIFKATKEKGIGQGVAEVAKAGARLTGASIGAAIGTSLGGPIGGIIGWTVGDWLTSKVVGKSYSEKKVEAEKKAQKQLAQQPQIPQDYNPYWLGQTTPTFTGNQNANNPFANNNYLNSYDNDIMMQGLNLDTLA